jgi:hypothetical protein
MNKSIILTAEDLRLAGACKFQTNLFEQTFPSGLPLTQASLKRILSNEGFSGKPNSFIQAGNVITENGWHLSYYLWSCLFRKEPNRKELQAKAFSLPWGSQEEKTFYLSWFKENKAKLTAAILKLREKELQANEK